MRGNEDDFGLDIGLDTKEGEGSHYLEPGKRVREYGHQVKEMGYEFIGFTVGDGFKFGCGFTLAVAIGTLAALILATAFLIIGALLGFKLPLG